jgi:hypothetical protein
LYHFGCWFTPRSPKASKLMGKKKRNGEVSIKREHA